jgi:hypothetical protein
MSTFKRAKARMSVAHIGDIVVFRLLCHSSLVALLFRATCKALYGAETC